MEVNIPQSRRPGGRLHIIGNLSDKRALSTQASFSAGRMIMSSHMPPVPPANRSPKGGGSEPEASKDKPVKHEHHANSAEEGETANIKQNTTNKGFFRGRRLG
jgi:hypothetical protein